MGAVGNYEVVTKTQGSLQPQEDQQVTLSAPSGKVILGYSATTEYLTGLSVSPDGSSITATYYPQTTINVTLTATVAEMGG